MYLTSNVFSFILFVLQWRHIGYRYLSYILYDIKLYFLFAHGRYAEDIAKVQKQYPSEPFKFLEPRFAVKLCISYK